MSIGEGAVRTPLGVVFAGRRGRLLIALLLAEFGAAVQGIAYSTVLPLAARDLHGSGLYGATLAAGPLSTVFILAAGWGALPRLGARGNLAFATGLYVVGVVMSVTAGSMGWLVVAGVLRGIAAGLLAAFGLTAIGALYEDDVRPRVLGLFALVWLLPSLAGPPLNAVVAVAWGWRWALAWPAVVVIAARVLVGRSAGVIPWKIERQRRAVWPAVPVVGGLVAASAAGGARWWGVLLLAGGVLFAGAAGIRILRRATDEPRRARTLLVFAGLCLAFFGADGLFALAVVEGLHRGVVAGSVVVGAALVAWSLTGLLPGDRAPRRPSPVTLGLISLTVALAVITGTQTGWLAPEPALGAAIVGAALAGMGMGLSYPRLSSGVFDGLPPDGVPAVATALAFAEVTATAVGSLVGGGTYSLATGLGVSRATAIGLAFALLTCFAAGMAAFSFRSEAARRI